LSPTLGVEITANDCLYWVEIMFLYCEHTVEAR